MIRPPVCQHLVFRCRHHWLQLPLPAHIDENAVLDAISFDKDADGLHPLNAGYLALKGRKALAVACTPKVSFVRLELTAPR